MISREMFLLGSNRSVIREIFEYSKKRAAEIGAENVFDFSIGNPNVPAPEGVHQAVRELLESEDDIYLHGYTSAQGDTGVRNAIAENLNHRFGTDFKAENLYYCTAGGRRRIHNVYSIFSGIQSLCGDGRGKTGSGVYESRQFPD